MHQKIYKKLHFILSKTLPQYIWQIGTNSPLVALTFDDGPNPQTTPHLLRILEKYQVQATFFCIGQNVQKYPEIVRQIHKQGHTIGIHGWQHEHFSLLGREQILQILDQTRNQIAQTIDVKIEDYIWHVRPPFGLFNPLTFQNLDNYKLVMWSIVPEDWKLPGKDLVTWRILNQVKNGSIIALHDGGVGCEQIAPIINELIPKLQAQGFKFTSFGKIASYLAMTAPINFA